MSATWSCTLLMCLLAGQPAADYVVAVDPGPKEEYLPAAKALAEFHRADLVRFDAGRLDEAFAELKKRRPKFVAFVLPPDRIDVDLSHRVLELSTALDDDPFADFEYGFITGRDGAAAGRFVERIRRAWKHKYRRRATFFASWEGQTLPAAGKLSAFKALKAEGELRLVLARAGAAERQKAAKQALESCKGKDALMFMSHGYPDEMVACFKAKDLLDWKADLAPAILVNCACYNGAPGRWFAPGRKGVEDKGVVARDDAVALAVLDSGVAGYFAGIDPWHGPLALQVFGHVFDDGLRLGEAAKAMHDRLALAFLPDRIRFEPTLKTPNRFGGEGTVNRRHNGGGMIFYGDPALAPFADSASKLAFAECKATDEGRVAIRLGWRPQLDGPPDQDFMLPMNRLMDYYSVKTADVLKELTLEVYRVVPLPKGDRAPALRVKSARAGKVDVPTKPVQAVVERTPAGNLLHVRVPLDARVLGAPWTFAIATSGITVEVEEVAAR